MAEELHQKGQKAGIYDAPYVFAGEDAGRKIPGAPGHTYEEILLRDSRGRILPKLDGSYPLDVTHLVWKQQMKWKLDRFVDWGFDYIKLDFLSHGAAEGCHYDRSICTGRQAIAVGYQWIADNLDKERIGKDFSIRRRSTGNSIWQCFTGRRKKRRQRLNLPGLSFVPAWYGKNCGAKRPWRTNRES